MTDITPTPTNNQPQRPRRNIDGIIRSGAAAMRSLRAGGTSHQADPAPEVPKPQTPISVSRPPSLSKLQAPLWTKYVPKPPAPEIPDRAPVAKPRANARLMDVAAPAAARSKPRPKPAAAPTRKPQPRPLSAKPTPAVRSEAPGATSVLTPKPAQALTGPPIKASTPASAEPRQTIPPIRKTFEAPFKPKSRKDKLLNILSYPLIIIGALAIGSVIYDQQAGQWLTIGFGILALVFKMDSRYIFAVALASLVGVIFSSVMKNDILADNFSVYAYLLLVFGTVATMLELQRTNKYRTKKHK